jgi:hypothetical protein
MLGGVDGDYFNKVTRLGRAVGDAVRAAAGGASVDPFPAAQLVDHLFARAGGLRSLRPILAILADLGSAPLLLPVRVDEAGERLLQAVRTTQGGSLDLRLARAALASIVRGETAPAVVLKRFFEKVLDAATIGCRGGLLESDGMGSASLARQSFEPVVARAVEESLRRPGAQRLGVVRHFRITAETDLLSGAP